MLTGEIMGAVGAGVGTALNLFGGARAAKRKAGIIAKQEAKNESWFNKDYFENPLEKLGSVAALTAMRQGHTYRMNSAKGSAAVMGASAGSMLAEKTAANEAMGQQMNTLAANAEQSQQAAKNRYMTRDAELANMKIDNEDKLQQSLSNAAASASKVGAGMMT